MVNAQVCFRLDVANQVLVDGFGDEWGERSQQFGKFNQDIVQRGISGVFIGVVLALPEAAATAANVPVAQIIEEGFDGNGSV